MCNFMGNCETLPITMLVPIDFDDPSLAIILIQDKHSRHSERQIADHHLNA